MRNPKKPIKHKNDYTDSHERFWSTRCGLFVSFDTPERIAITWRATTCKNCLRIGKRLPHRGPRR